MCLVLIDADAHTIAIRQSWLGTALTCPNRGRLAIVRADLDWTGDAAAAGTAMHRAIEDVLNGRCDPADIGHAAKDHALYVLEEEPVQWKSFASRDEFMHHAANCAEAWVRDVYPSVAPLGVLGTELDFNFPAFEHDGWEIQFQGTCDLIPLRSNTLWDWKSSGSKWKQRDKQRSDVQATIYALAAVNGCFDREFHWPIEFNFGVMVRAKGPAKGHIVTVQRTAEHARWVERRVRQYVDLALNLGLHTEWPALDEHYLCSQKWCPWYGACRGKHLTADHDLYGYQAA